MVIKMLVLASCISLMTFAKPMFLVVSPYTTDEIGFEVHLASLGVELV